METHDPSELERRIEQLAQEVAHNRDMITDLQADQLADQAQTEQLEKALMSSRMIGAAVGILMNTRGVSQAEAFEVLRSASQRTNRKLRELAADIVQRAEAGETAE